MADEEWTHEMQNVLEALQEVAERVKERQGTQKTYS